MSVFILLLFFLPLIVCLPGPFGSNDLPEQRLLATEKTALQLY